MKSRSESDEGISERILVACHNKCNIPLKSHRDSLRDPAAATPCASACSLRSTRRSSTALRMTYQILFGCFRLTLRKKTPQKGETKNATRRQSLQKLFCVGEFDLLSKPTQLQPKPKGNILRRGRRPRRPARNAFRQTTSRGELLRFYSSQQNSLLAFPLRGRCRAAARRMR